MARLGIDVSGVRTPFSPLPEGNYRLKVVDVESKKSQAGENMLSLQYEVMGGEQAGKKLFNVAMLEGKGEQSGKFTIHQHCLIAGDNPSDPDPDTWKNTEFDAEVMITEGKRGPQNNITILKEIPS